MIISKIIIKISIFAILSLLKGCEQLETGTECMLNDTDSSNSNSNSHHHNRSTESIKKRLSSSGGFLKLDDSTGIDEIDEARAKLAKNLKTTINGNNASEEYAGSRCLCNAMETDADCCNSEIELGHIVTCNGHIHSGSGSPRAPITGPGQNICQNDPDKNKLIAIRGDFLGNLSINHKQAEPNANTKIGGRGESAKTGCRNPRLAHSNWMLANFCCGAHQNQQQHSPADSTNKPYSPSPVCEHVRSIDTHHHKRASPPHSHNSSSHAWVMTKYRHILKNMLFLERF